MKKLMVAMTIALVAGLTQASTIKWSVSDVYQSPAGDPTKKAGNTYQMLCFLSSDSTGNYNTISEADAVAAIKSGSIDAKYVIDNGKLFNGSKSTTAMGSFVTGDTISGFAIILDAVATTADGKYKIGADNYMLVDSGTTTITFKADGSAETFAMGSQASSTWQSVPEPTSGLLLLLGVAGLALRRKQK